MKCRLLLAAAAFSFRIAAYAQNEDSAPRHEVGLTLGRLFSADRTSQAGKLTLESGTALQANYGLKLVEGRLAALYGEVHFLANPQRLVNAADRTATRDVATIFLTPGVRVKFRPHSAVSPYLAAGGGYAAYEQSLNRLDGQSNPAPRTTQRGVFDFGGGVDFTLWKWIGFRAEVRDFYAGSPGYNLPGVGGGQHNVVAGGGFVLRCH